MSGSFSITNKTKMQIPRLPFSAIKNDILGKNYALSLACVDKEVSRKINRTYRKKNKATNILSFAFSKTEGEIVLCPSVIKKEIQNKNKHFGKNYRELLGFLVIHGMLHLKGLRHGGIMEKAEKKYDQKYFYRNRRRFLYN